MLSFRQSRKYAGFFTGRMLSSLPPNKNWLQHYHDSFGALGPDTRKDISLTYDQMLERKHMGLDDRQVKGDILSEFDFSKELDFGKSNKSRLVLNSIVLSLLRCVQDGKGLRYSRSRGYYAASSTGFLGLHTVKNAVQFLVENGYAYNFIAPPGTHVPQSSFLYPTPLFNERFGKPPLNKRVLYTDNFQAITVRTRDTKEFITVPKTLFYKTALIETVEHNEFLSTFNYGLAGKIVSKADSEITYMNSKGETATIDTQRTRSVRRFIKSEDSRYPALGGRYNGGFWQGMNGKDRSRITIDGEPVGPELDYSCIGVKIAYSKLGFKLNDDAYVVNLAGLSLRKGKVVPYIDTTTSRDIVKKAIHISMNSDGRRKAASGLAKEIINNHSKIFGSFTFFEVQAYANKVIGRILVKHSDISQVFFSDFGIISQHIESEIMTDIQQECRKKGIPILSIHDSILYPASKSAVVEGIFNEKLHKRLKSLSNSKVLAVKL